MKHKAKPSGSSGGSRLRLALLVATAAAFLLVPVAQAAANGTLTVTMANTGSGSGEVSSVGGFGGFGIYEGEPPIECSGPPATGVCSDKLSNEGEGFEAVALHAVAKAGSTFTGWTVEEGLVPFGESCETYTECFVAVPTGEGNAKVKATFAPAKPKFKLTVTKSGNGSGTVTSKPEGINCGGTCSAEFEEGQLVELSQQPATGTLKGTWTSGPCKGTNNAICKVTLSEALTVNIEFPLSTEGVSVELTGNGLGTVSSSPAGVPSDEFKCGPTSCGGSFFYGTEVTLTANPGVNSAFTGWSGSGCSGTGTCKVTATSSKELSASFESTVSLFALTVSKTGTGPGGTVTSNPGGIECGGTCSAEFAENTKVTLTASPAANSAFISWKGCEKGGAVGHTCKVTMDKAKTVEAKFGPTQSITLTKAGSGSGKVSSSPSGVSCDLSCSSNVAAFTEGASVVLTAVPTKYNTFAGWSGSGCSGTGTCTVTMSAAKAVTAEFAVTKYALTLNKAGGGTGATKSKPASLSCGATCSSVVSSFYAGTEVEVTATPSKGSTLNWSVGSGTCTGSTSPCFVTMSAAKSLTAEFK